MIDAGYHFIECFWHSIYTQDVESLKEVISPEVSVTIQRKGDSDITTFQGREAFLESIRSISENATAIIGNAKVYNSNVHKIDEGRRIVEVHFTNRFKVENLAAPELHREGDQKLTFVYTGDRWLLTEYSLTNYIEIPMAEGAVLVSSDAEGVQNPATSYRYCVIS